MREIIICNYDPNWPHQFDNERIQLLSIFEQITPIAIEHIGSTSVPLLGAKPVIDIMIGVEHEHELDLLIAPIEMLGYSYGKEHEVDMPFRRFFRKDTNGIRSHHIHAVTRSHPFWETHLAFREHLRTNPLVAQEYETLKRKLAGEHRFDPDGYSTAKGPFITSVLEPMTQQT